MNAQRYILPVSIAAVFHAALLWSSVNEPSRARTRLHEILLPTKPTTPDERVVPPADDKREDDQPVQPLGGGPIPPAIDDPPMKPKPADLVIPIETRTTNFRKDLNIIPPDLSPSDNGREGPGGLNPNSIFSSVQLDRIPRATLQPPPDYPVALHHQNITGSVTVEFDVDTQGRVVRAEAIRYTNREFAEPAVRAVRQWHFEPGRRNGIPVRFRMAVPIEFSLAAD